MNTFLFYSALFCTVCHALFMVLLYPAKIFTLPSLLMAIGCTTSLLNHGTYSLLLKWIDRVAMYIAVVLHFVYTDKLMVSVAVFFYLISKIVEPYSMIGKNLLDMVTHATGTLLDFKYMKMSS